MGKIFIILGEREVKTYNRESRVPLRDSKSNGVRNIFYNKTLLDKKRMTKA